MEDIAQRRSARIRTQSKTVVIADATSDDVIRKRKRISKEVTIDDDDFVSPKAKKKKSEKSQDDVDETSNKVKKSKRPKPEPVYVIPDVEKRETQFRGRLGYACLNTVLRNKKPASESVFCSRTCRIDSIKKNGMDWVKELGRKNVQDLITMIQWNEDNKIRFLPEAGALAEKYGHRLTSHPGQFTQLGSPKPAVVESSIRELEYHCQMLELMGVGKDGVTILHGGGVYDDKPAAIERIKTTIRDVLPKNVRDRLVLENDELCYNAEDLLPICEELDVPLVFDYHHDALNPSSIPPATIIEARQRDLCPEPRPGAITLMERRAHADRCERLPDEVELEDVAIDVDLMIEAKDKEQAVLHLYRIYGLEEVKVESLRPPNENQTKETKGRKSNKKAKGSKAKANDEDSGGLSEV
ncbi:UV-endonuclease UvdE [Gymnopus androsaceus JB14]|uniref:UV-endonuclease UvdE n=1 Tax=Gymnopus androsaceus JB14 TaxID=1447944 RepID=A0A6A4I0X2_9AGAR|nr:UV-endonuclease UvdE [Gymnopus androsaceus JB14]